MWTKILPLSQRRRNNATRFRAIHFEFSAMSWASVVRFYTNTFWKWNKGEIKGSFFFWISFFGDRQWKPVAIGSISSANSGFKKPCACIFRYALSMIESGNGWCSKFSCAIFLAAWKLQYAGINGIVFASPGFSDTSWRIFLSKAGNFSISFKFVSGLSLQSLPSLKFGFDLIKNVSSSDDFDGFSMYKLFSSGNGSNFFALSVSRVWCWCCGDVRSPGLYDKSCI